MVERDISNKELVNLMGQIELLPSALCCALKLYDQFVEELLKLLRDAILGSIAAICGGSDLALPQI